MFESPDGAGWDITRLTNMKNIIRIFCIVFLSFSVIAVAAQPTVCSNPKCHGGKIYCEECDGVGTVKNVTCKKCNGKGTYSCPNCNGTGIVNGTGNVNNNVGGNSTGNVNSSVSGNRTGNVNSNVSGNSTSNVNSSENGSSTPTRHQFDCPVCKGRGEIPKSCPNPKCHNGTISCENCKATGTVDHMCTACNGKGEVTTHKRYPCPECNGKKYVMQDKQVKCTHCRNGKVPAPHRPSIAQSETVWVDHAECKGTGFITVKEKVTCPRCKGRAYMIELEPSTVKCESCGGSGHIKETCKQCAGKGSYTCPTCKGYGNVREHCSRCNGTGVIYTD